MKLHREILIASTLLGSWLGMQAVHELGHVSGAWVTGGKVQRVVLHPLTISRTDLAENPSPLAVVWAGPLLGSLLPILLWLVAAAAKMPGNFVLQFFAGFCLIANGVYISLGSFGRIGDCGEMLRTAPPSGNSGCSASSPFRREFGFGTGWERSLEWVNPRRWSVTRLPTRCWELC